MSCERRAVRCDRQQLARLGLLCRMMRASSNHNDEVQFNFRGLELYVTYATTGEIAEWRAELRSTDLAIQKEAIKKGIRMLLIIVTDPTANTVIAAMTVGKDVSGLFPDVLQCMQTTNLELKKLIYLYLINYAKSKPELTILAVNTFIKVLSSHFPHI